MTGPWQPEDIALVFLTCPREQAYFPVTLASALLGDPRAARLREIVVVVDAPDLACVEPLAQHGRVRWVARTAEENERVASFRVHRRVCHNYWRALGLAGAGARALLVCEDDVVFRDGWLGMLLECLEEMRAGGLTDFMLAAYARYDMDQPARRCGTYYSSYPGRDFYATQAMLYPAGECAGLRAMLWERGVVKMEQPCDLLIGRHLMERKHLYATRYSLVQHVGLKSTGLSIGGQQSESFGQPWPAPASDGEGA